MECPPYNGTKGLLFFETPHHIFSKMSLISNDIHQIIVKYHGGKKKLIKKIVGLYVGQCS
jgi:hypothetical protein